MRYKKISIIIPIFNVEEYLTRCIASIFNQSFDINAMQILLMYDVSTDKTLEIANAYVSDFPDILEIHILENAGLGGARDVGLKHAHGAYVLFIDADDYIDPDYIEKFYSSAVQNNADIVYGGYKRPDQSGKIKKVFQPLNNPYGKYALVSAWAKIFRTSFLVENRIDFSGLRKYEDILFTIAGIAKAKKIVVIDYVGYNYFIRSGEGALSKSNKTLSEELDGFLAMLDRIRELIATVDPEIEYFILRFVIGYSLLTGTKEKPGIFKDCIQKEFSWINANCPNWKGNKYLLSGPKGEQVFIKLSISAFIVIYRAKLLGIFALLYCRGK